MSEELINLRRAVAGKLMRGANYPGIETIDGFTREQWHTIYHALALESRPAPASAPVPEAGTPLRKLGERLAQLLDEDQFAECEALLLAAHQALRQPITGNLAFDIQINAGPDAAPSAPSVAHEYDDDIKQMMRFYAVSDLVSLARIQSEHVARLQKKLPPMRDEQPRNPRAGGE